MQDLVSKTIYAGKYELKCYLATVNNRGKTGNRTYPLAFFKNIAQTQKLFCSGILDIIYAANTSNINFSDRKTYALIDTGAETSSCSFYFYSKFALSEKLSQSDVPSIKGVSGHRLQVLGKVTI